MNTNTNRFINSQRALEHGLLSTSLESLQDILPQKAIIRLHNFKPYKVQDQVEIQEKSKLQPKGSQTISPMTRVTSRKTSAGHGNQDDQSHISGSQISINIKPFNISHVGLSSKVSRKHIVEGDVKF